MLRKMAYSVAFGWVVNEPGFERFDFKTECGTEWSFGRVSQDLCKPPTIRRENNFRKSELVKMSFIALSPVTLKIFKKSSKHLHFDCGIHELTLSLPRMLNSQNESKKPLKMFCKITVHTLFDSNQKSFESAAIDESNAEITRMVEILSESQTFASWYQDTQDLLESGVYSDALLICGSKKLRVHKAILSARSAKFSARFSRRKVPNCINVTDVEEDVLLKMLTFMYTDLVDDSNFDAIRDLYFAADKYQVQGLKNACRNFLKDKITLDTIRDVLDISKILKDNELKESALNFTFNHFQQLTSSDAWDLLLTENHSLGLEILNIAISIRTSQNT